MFIILMFISPHTDHTSLVSIQLARGQHSANNEEFLIWLKEYTLVVTFNSPWRLICPSSE